MRRLTITRRLGVLACLFALPLAGCAIGNTARIDLTRTTTIGQELIDLKEAKDKGAMTEEEYQKAKSDIMKQANWSEITATPGKSKK